MCIAIAASGMLSSCSEDMPNVNFMNVVSNTSDFREVIRAIENQTLSLAQKLNLVNETLKSTNTTLAQKLQLIEAAVNNGVATYKELADALVESINALNATQEAKLQAIYEIINSNNITLAQKLADIEAAISKGFEKHEYFAKLIIESIKDLQTSQEEKLQAIHDILDSQLASLSLKVECLSAAIEQGFIDNAAAIDALNAAIVQALSDNNADLTACLTEIKNTIDSINTSIDNGFILQNAAIAAMSEKLIVTINSNAKSEAEKINAVAAAIIALKDNIKAENGNLVELLKELKTAIEKRTDYSEIIKAIKDLAEKLKA